MARPLAVLGLTFFTAMWACGVFGVRAAIACAAASTVLSVLCLCVRRLRRTIVFPCVCIVIAAACLLFVFYEKTEAEPIRSLVGETVTVSAHMTDFPSSDETEFTLMTDLVDETPMRFELTLRTLDPVTANLSDEFVFKTKLSLSGDKYYAFAPEVALVPQKPTLTSRMLSMRRYAETTLRDGVPGTPGIVLAALLTGDADAVPADVYARMRSSGILHLFAVSGFNLSVFSAAFLMFFEKHRIYRVFAVLPSVFAVLFMTAFTGYSLSCIRACLMILLMLVGRCFFKRSDALNALGFSVLVIALFDPPSVMQIGFQLSVIGTLGVILVSPAAEKLTKKIRIKPRSLQRFVQAFLTAMFVSACISLMTLPVILPVFGRVSVVSPLANACLLSAAEIALVGAVISVLLSLCPPLLFLQKLLLLVSGLLAKYCIAVSDFFGNLSFAYLRTGGLTIIWTAGTLLLIAAALLLPGSVRRKTVCTAGVSVVCFLCMLLVHGLSEKGTVHVTVLDIGSNTAVLVQSEGESMLIGSGDSSNLPYRLGKYIDKLDRLLVPRFAETESGSASKLVRSIPTDTLLVPTESDVSRFRVLGQAAACTPVYDGTVGQAELHYRWNDGQPAVCLEMHGKTMLLLFSPSVDLNAIPAQWLRADILWVRSDVPPGLCAENYGAVLIACGAEHAETAQRICNQGGLAAATAGSGDLRLSVDREGLIDLERKRN